MKVDPGKSYNFLLPQKNYTNFLTESGLEIDYTGSFTTNPHNISLTYSFTNIDLTYLREGRHTYPAISCVFSWGDSNDNTLEKITLNNVVTLNSGMITIGYFNVLTELNIPALTILVGSNFGINNLPLLNKLDLSSLEIISDNSYFNIFRLDSLKTLDLPSLEIIDDNSYFRPNNCDLLTKINLPSLKTISNGSQFNPYNLIAVEILNLPALEILNGYFNPYAFPACTTINLPKLTTISNSAVFCPYNLDTCTTINVPNLSILDGGYFSPGVGLSMLKSLSFPSMIRVTGGGNFNLGGLGLENVTLGTVGVFKEYSNTVDLSNNSLTQESVDGVLELLASLDGTNGTILFTGETVDLNGGTNSTPSTTGLDYIDILTDRGNFVYTN